MRSDETTSDAEGSERLQLRHVLRIGEPQLGTPEPTIDLEGARRTGKWPFPMAIPCQICGKPSRIIRHLFSCREHYQARLVRQRTGVTLAELTSRWEDSLATWKDRPAELTREESPELFRLWGPLHEGQSEKDWLLFGRGYPNRSPDWIAYDRKTRQIQRFVSVSYEDVAEELLGGNKATGQDRLDQMWGRAGEGSIFDRLLESVERLKSTTPSGMPPLSNITKIVEEAPFPVYGLADAFMNLTLGSFSFGGGGALHLVGSVTLSFIDTDNKEVESHVGVCIESRRKQYRVIHQELELKEELARDMAREVWANFVPPATHEAWVAGNKSPTDSFRELGPERRELLAVHLKGFDERATALAWDVPRPLFGFLLENEPDQLQVAVGTFGLTLSEIEELTRRMSPLESSSSVLVAYQVQRQAQFAKLREEAQRSPDQPSGGANT